MMPLEKCPICGGELMEKKGEGDTAEVSSHESRR